MCLLICMNMLPSLCFAPLIYLIVFSPLYVFLCDCAPLEYKQSGRGRHYGLFSYLLFGSLVKLLLYVALGTSCLYFIVTCRHSFWVVEPLFYSFVIETLYVKLYYSRCLIHMVKFCWFYVWWNIRDSLSVKLKLNYFTKC